MTTPSEVSHNSYKINSPSCKMSYTVKYPKNDVMNKSLLQR